MYRILGFDTHYVTADMRRKQIKKPSWFKCPTETPEVTALIFGHPDGLAHLGIWERMQCWAVRNWKTEGAFITAEGTMTVPEIGFHVGLPCESQMIETALSRFVKLGWMSWAEDGQEMSTTIPRQRQDLSCTEKRREEKKREEKKDTRRRSRIQWSVDEGWQGITDADRSNWTKAFPSVEVEDELARMTSWLTANPSKANKSQWSRFVNSWLSRTQDQHAARAKQGAARPVQSTGWASEAERGGHSA